MGADWFVPMDGRLIRCESYEEAWNLFAPGDSCDNIDLESAF